jgi:hypothetical protein
LSKNSTEDTNEANGEAHLLSFVVRLWREEPASEETQVNWRGHITSVPNGKRRYFKSLTEIPDLIAANLSLQK